MSHWEKSRVRIFNTSQHPLRHDLSEFFYSNPRIPGVTDVEGAVDYLISVMYPNYIGTYATPAALPGGASPNDYAIVTDDGDGKSAGYVYVTNDGASAWMKRYDVDWSLENILAETVNRTMPMYIARDGFDQKDASGNAIVGTYAGQTFVGGSSTGTNLTLDANATDATGYVQSENTFRPTANGTLDLGTNALKWANGYINVGIHGTLTVQGGSITDSTGAISFDNENLTTSGEYNAGTLKLQAGSISDSSGAITFVNENLSTTGTLAAGTTTISADMVLATGSITSASGAITFDNENLSTTGTLGAGNTTVTRLDSDNVRIDGNTISATNINGGLSITSNGSGIIAFTGDITSGNQTTTGTLAVTGQVNADNLRLDGNTFSSTNANADILLSPNGSGLVDFTSGIYPDTDSSFDIGKTGKVWNKLWIDGSIGGAVNEITVTDLMSLRSSTYRDTGRTQPAQAGDSLFYDAINAVWLASAPDTEITHGGLSGLTTGDAGHTQFALLAGRAGGQSVQGGTAASENLTLDSTAHGTKGDIKVSSDVIPTTNASYAAGWTGTDLGDNTHFYRDIYMKGEARNLRAENFTAGGLPAASSQNEGRLAFATDTNKLYVDNGGTWIVAGVSSFQSDTAWNGTDITKTVTVSSTITDARTALWQLCDNTNDFERIYCSIKAISATQVKIDVGTPLPAGSFRLIGHEA